MNQPSDQSSINDLRVNGEGGSSADIDARSFDPEDFPLDRYRPIRALGTGTAGRVYLCQDLMLAKEVALKILRAVDGEKLMAFQQEAKATSKLNHAKIVRVFDFGATTSGIPYMVMEFFDGVSLDRIIEDEGPLSIERAAEIFLQVCEALGFAHQLGVFHRDLKTSNLLIKSDDHGEEVRLIDFGIASVRYTNAPIVMQGKTIVGTPSYMSPDQCGGLEYDERSEIYSLGCVIFESLTGSPPFVADTALETIAKHANEPPPHLSDLRRFHGTATEFEHIVSRCLEKNPDDRYQSMAELKTDLESIVHSEPAAAAVYHLL